MTAQNYLRAVLRDVLGPAARRHGYKGSPPTWRRSSPAGDWAVVNVQSSAFSSAAHLRCVANLAFAPEPWLRWKAEGLGAGMPMSVPESLGLYRQRLHPGGTTNGTDGWWDVFDVESARRAVSDISSQLDRSGWLVLDRMFSREAMTARVRDGDLGMLKRPTFEVFFARAEALLLMDAGPSEALESRLRYALSRVNGTQRDDAAHFDTWVRAEAAKA